MANLTLDTVILVDKPESNGSQKLLKAYKEVLLKSTDRNGNEQDIYLRDLFDYFDATLPVQINDFARITNIRMDNGNIKLSGRSRWVPNAPAYEFLAKLLGMDYYLYSVDMMSDLNVNTDINGVYHKEYCKLVCYNKGGMYDYIENIDNYYFGVSFETAADVTEFIRTKLNLGIPECVAEDIKMLKTFLHPYDWFVTEVIREILDEDTHKTIDEAVEISKVLSRNKNQNKHEKLWGSMTISNVTKVAFEAFNTKASKNGLAKLEGALQAVGKEGKVSDVIKLLNIKKLRRDEFVNTHEIYEGYEMNDGMLFIYIKSRGIPDMAIYEILSQCLDLKHYIISGSYPGGSLINTDVDGCVFKSRYLLTNMDMNETYRYAKELKYGYESKVFSSLESVYRFFKTELGITVPEEIRMASFQNQIDYFRLLNFSVDKLKDYYFDTEELIEIGLTAKRYKAENI